MKVTSGENICRVTYLKGHRFHEKYMFMEFVS